MNFIRIFIFICFSASLSGQTYIEGVVIDSTSRQPLAFASIAFNDNPQSGTTTDIDGKFYYNSPVALTQLTCSYIGYEKQHVNLKNEDFITVYLNPSAEQLKEVVLTPSENPALAIIRKVIENKNSNNPENLHSFSYKSYTKTLFDIRDKDTISRLENFKDSHLFITENVTNRKYLSPDLDEEEVIATRVSGFKNPAFAWLTSDFQPFSFYQETLKLLDLYYLNPVSNGALNQYDFRLEETLYQEKDTVHVVSFKPRSGKNFEALEGLLYINTKKYAIQNVIAEPFEKNKINLKIRQQYKLIDDKHWFPEQLNYELSFQPEVRSGKQTTEQHFFIDGKTYIDSVIINPPLRRKDFSVVNIRMNELAGSRDSLFWEQYRSEPLNEAERKTYHLMDSISEKNNLEKRLALFEKLPFGRFPVGFIDIDLSKTMVYNKYEGFRLGTGFYTNEKLFKHIAFGGFFGFGLRDNQWKYGAEIRYDSKTENDFFVSGAFRNDLAETGRYGLSTFDKEPFFKTSSARQIFAYQFDNIRQVSLSVGARNFRYLQWEARFNHSRSIPRYDYRFQSDNQLFTSYANSNIQLYLNFAYKERMARMYGRNLSLGTKYPVFSAVYTRGLKGVFESDFEYNQIEIRAEQSFFTKRLGLTAYRAEGGYTDRALPYGLLFTGEGGFDENFPFLTENSFQTMRPYEFLSDRYVHLFLSHNFSSLLFKSGSFQPEVVLHQNIGWGTLFNPEAHQFIAFRSKENIFLESGLMLNNLLKINYLNIAGIGFGGGLFYRYGYYSHTNSKDNIALKFSMSFSVK